MEQPMNPKTSITLFLMDLKTWFVIIMVLCFGLAIFVASLHRKLGEAEQQERAFRYEQQRSKTVQQDQKKLDEFRYGR